MLNIDWTLPVSLVSVVIFLVLMNQLLFKPLMQFMEARSKRIRDDLEEAARLRQQAEDALATYDSALGIARRDLTEQAAGLQRALDAKQREHIEQARTTANTLVAEAQATIAQETAEARQRLAAEAHELARLVAVKLIGREVGR
jgi:F-type H+-transporting ATPase subunit b